MNFTNKEQYLEHGKLLFDKLGIAILSPRCMPSVPDRHIDDDEYLSDIFTDLDEFKSNKDIFKILEDKKKSYILSLCEVNISHKQLQMWNPQHSPEDCAQTANIPNCSLEHRGKVEARNDFIVFGEDFIVLIQVVNRKAPNYDATTFPEKIRTKELDQFKTVQLIQSLEKVCLQDKTKERDIRVFRFFAYPKENEPQCVKLISSSAASVESAENREHSCNEHCIPVIVKEDWHNIEHWWEQNIVATEVKPFCIVKSNVIPVIHVMLAIRTVKDENLGTYDIMASHHFSITNVEPQKPAKRVNLKKQSPDESYYDTLPRKKGRVFRPTRHEGQFKYEHFRFIDRNSFAKYFETEIKLEKITEYFEVGEKFFGAFRMNDGFAEMFPSCPKQQYIDLYSEDERSKAATSSNIVTDHQKQQDYEAEVLVFRALERIQAEQITVLHGAKYTHYQYRMFCQHSPKGCHGCKKSRLHADEGENDFVIFGPNYIVLIEVKNAFCEISDRNSVKKFVQSAAKQQDRVVEIIKGIIANNWEFDDVTPLQHSDIPLKVLRFVAFPGSTTRPDLVDCGVENDIKDIIATDLENFASWWKLNVRKQVNEMDLQFQNHIEIVRNVFLSLWAVANNQIIDSSKLGLYNEVFETDKKLKESEITFEGKRTDSTNPNVFKTSKMPLKTSEKDEIDVVAKKIFHDVLGIRYITKEQLNAYENESEHIIITGCTGSGKSCILLARFFRHILEDLNSKFILVVFNQKRLTDYEALLKKIGIDCVNVMIELFDPRLWQGRVIVVHCSSNLNDLQSSQLVEILISGAVVYIDDAHASYIDFSLFPCACLTFDFNQSFLKRDQMQPWESLHVFHVMQLSRNLRSTSCIASTLTSLSKFMESKEATQSLQLKNEPLYSTYHPIPGHLIQGPQLFIEVCHASIREPHFRDTIESLLPTIQYSTKSLFTSGFVVLDTNDSWFLKNIRHVLRTFFVRDNIVYAEPGKQNICSLEFPVCYIFYQFVGIDDNSLRLLFNAMSRARAYCHVLIYPDEKNDRIYDELEEFLQVFKNNKVKLCCANEIDQNLQNSAADISSFKKSTLLRQRLEIFRLGLEIDCFKRDGFAIMMPACPKIAKLNSPGAENIIEDYQIEVTIYRALEQLKYRNLSDGVTRLPNVDRLTVFQGLKISHHQYKLWRSLDNNKENSSSKSDNHKWDADPLTSYVDEHDFVVIGSNFIVLIEIKKVSSDLSKFLEAATKKQDQLLSVIKEISSESFQIHDLEETEDPWFFRLENEDRLRHNSFPYRVFRCVAISNMTEIHKEAPSFNKSCFSNLRDDQSLSIGLLKSSNGCYDFPNSDNHRNFDNWWKQNIEAVYCSDHAVTLQGNLFRVQVALSAMLSTNESGNRNFDSCMSEIEKSLQEGKISFENRISEANRASVESSEILRSAEVIDKNIFSHFLGYSYLTLEQRCAYEKESESLVITGCAGSGKSAILIARLIRDILTTNKKGFLLLVFSAKKVAEYKKVFADASIETFDASEKLFCDANLSRGTRLGIYYCNHMITDDTAEHLKTLMSEMIVYVDDAHASMSSINFFSFHCACIAFDVFQCNLPSQQLNCWDQTYNCDIVSLKYNYRSTSNVVYNLQRLYEFIQKENDDELSFTKDSLFIPHYPLPGHFIHGPQTIVDICYESLFDDEDYQFRVFDLIHYKLLSLLRDSQQPLFFHRFFLDIDEKHCLLKNLLGLSSKRLFDDNECIMIHPLEADLYSNEFSACIILINISDLDRKKLRLLYNVMSRSRVFCYIILFHDTSLISEVSLDNFLGIFDNAKITHYDLIKRKKSGEKTRVFEANTSVKINTDQALDQTDYQSKASESNDTKIENNTSLKTNTDQAVDQTDCQSKSSESDYPKIENNNSLKTNTDQALDQTDYQSKASKSNDTKIENNTSLKTNTDQALDQTDYQPKASESNDTKIENNTSLKIKTDQAVDQTDCQSKSSESDYPKIENNTSLKTNTDQALDQTDYQSKASKSNDPKFEHNTSLKTSTDQVDDRKADRFKANVELLSEKADSSGQFVYIPLDDSPYSLSANGQFKETHSSASRAVKGVYRVNIRQLQLKNVQNGIFPQLKSWLLVLFPHLASSGTDLSVRWRDSDGDKIPFSSDQELQDALNQSAVGGFLVFVEHLKPLDLLNSLQPSVSDDPVVCNSNTPPDMGMLHPVHAEVQCDNCHRCPIFGTRYKCKTCDDFDLCHSCMLKGTHNPNHKFWKL
ncbi:uncharacterized protein LOC134841549 [Symsagittifera roscoffensis]|uniref:uncharacterized protein LOC134841549 n=1 Tax=Symsagittifera roscoffensis TaxID=84072 RepID=UPI00307B5851